MRDTLDSRPDPRRWWILAALCSVLVLVGLDLTVLNVAVPVIGADLSASSGELQWVVNGYTVVLAALLLPVGQLGDRFGRKRLLLLGLIVFGGASLVCALAPGPEILIAGRALLGLGAAFLNTLGLSVLVTVFGPQERPKAIGIQAAAVSAGMPLGPIVGGFLLERFGWPSVFLLNLPLVVLAFVALAVLVRQSRAGHVRVDVVGGVLAVVSLALLSYGLISAGETSWANVAAIAAIVAGLLLLVAFVAVQRRVRAPMADLSLFADPRFTWGSVLSTAVQFIVFGAMFVLPQFSYVVHDATPLQIGLHLLPLVLAMVVAVGIAGRLRPIVGTRVVLAGGFVVLGVGLGLGAMWSGSVNLTAMEVWTALVGFGFGASMPPALDVALEPVPQRRSGVGAALLQAQRQVGAVLGVAIMGSVLAQTYRGRMDTSQVPGALVHEVEHSAASGDAVAAQIGSPGLADAVADAFSSAMAGSMWLACAIAIGCAVVSLIVRIDDRSVGAGVEQGVDA